MILIGTMLELVRLVSFFGLFLVGNCNDTIFVLKFSLVFSIHGMARKIYLRGGLGVGAFQRIYGGSQSNGSHPSHFCKSSGSVARRILQQLQSMNIIEIDTKGGRRITSSGQRDLDQVAGRIAVAP
ncbi:unnamed protein product [Lupinus luteus]|uniref:40S ribosomal protein S19 n=1 Tax=Lupinus luteus TaxID=3873 RepID=A0AAV1Y642_LUPLU